MDEATLGVLPIIIWLAGIVVFFSWYIIKNWKYLFEEEPFDKHPEYDIKKEEKE